MKNKVTKRILAGILMLTVVVVGFIIPDSVQAEGTFPVRYQEVKYSVMKDCIGKTAPECTLEKETSTNVGYLFAGWYKIADNSSPIEVVDDVEGATDDTVVYAKFIPSYLAGIACQVDTNENANTRNLRVVSLVDSKNYKAVGFNIYGRYNTNPSEDDSNETEWLMYTYSSESQNKAESTKVYTGLNDYSKGDTPEVKTPVSVFGEEAKGFYFTTVSITGIGVKGAYDFRDATMAVKPYWITLDGTYVEGMGEFNRVNDAGTVVNVSVNLKNATAIAAGMLDITVPDGFTYTDMQVESGRVFEEMTPLVNDSVIKCVGNVSGMTDSTKANEVYINLRFTVEDTDAITKGDNKFTVTTKGFCDMEENFDKTVKAWDVKY